FFSSRRRHTRFSRDWSSDVCSSDLGRGGDGDGRGCELCSGKDRPHIGSKQALASLRLVHGRNAAFAKPGDHVGIGPFDVLHDDRSEERRVGKEGKTWRLADGGTEET